jgi:DNA-directed RNA polymerase specialized sigma24 family protein
MKKLKGEALRLAWDNLNKTKTKEQIATMISKTDAYWEYVKKYEPRFPEITFSELGYEVVDNIPADNSDDGDINYNELRSVVSGLLTPLQDKILAMREDGYSYREISLVIGKKTTAIRQIMRRTRNKLKKHLYNEFWR